MTRLQGDATRQLDMELELTPLEDQAPVSWEVERERFIRDLGEGLA